MNIKTINYSKEIARVVINEPKTYNSLSYKNLKDLINIFKKLDKDKKIKDRYHKSRKRRRYP